MIITKNKKQFNSFDIKGITEGKLLAIARSLQIHLEEGKITPVGQDVLNSIIIALNKNSDNLSITMGLTHTKA